MNRSSTVFLKSVLIIIGLVVVSICIFAIPRIIATFQPGGYDPILVGLYIPAIPFLFALFNAFQLLNYIEKEEAFSLASVTSFRRIKYCALTISGLFAAGMPYIFYVADKDDAPGVVAMAFIIIFASFVIATFAAVMQRLVQHAVDLKEENDLTV